MSDKIAKLKQAIEIELNLCNSNVTPTVCSMIVGDRHKLTELIVEKIVNNGATIGEAIIEIEHEYNANLASN